MFVVGAFAAYAEEQPVAFDKMPAEAQEFVQKYFAGEPIRAVHLDRDSKWNTYTVYFENGNQIAFDGGNCECSAMEMKHGSIPTAVLPAQLQSYLSQHYPSQGVVKLQRTDGGYMAGLSNGVCVDFDKQGNFVKSSRMKQ